MDSIVTTALVGTAQSQQPEITTGTPVDALTAHLGENSVERALLLNAGARAIYRQAGQIAGVVPVAPAPAEPETLPACSPRAASLLVKMLAGEFSELLPEALQRMRKAGFRLPNELLPDALDVKGAGERAMVAPVIGERGRWLSQFNPAWSWVADYLPISDDPGDAETIWQDGAQGQREALLRRLRTTDPAKAREWLIAAWKQEKAETRALFLKTLKVQLSNDDETFLEKALDDRSSEVRAVAASLLASLPASALSRRMQARADAMLCYKRGEITVKPVMELPRDWQRDGITAKAPGKMNETMFWFGQILSLVPPQRWEERFGMTASDLIDVRQSDLDWRDEIIVAWTKATILHHSETWLMPLWEWYYRQKPMILHTGLMNLMTQEVAEQTMMRVFADEEKDGPRTWTQALAALPRPWSDDFSVHLLQKLGQYLESFLPDRYHNLHYDSWYMSLPVAMQSLSPDCFPLALHLPDVPDVQDERDYNMRLSRENFQKHLRMFKEGIRLRQQLIKEIG